MRRSASVHRAFHQQSVFLNDIRSSRLSAHRSMPNFVFFCIFLILLHQFPPVADTVLLGGGDILVDSVFLTIAIHTFTSTKAEVMQLAKFFLEFVCLQNYASLPAVYETW